MQEIHPGVLPNILPGICGRLLGMGDQGLWRAMKTERHTAHIIVLYIHNFVLILSITSPVMEEIINTYRI